MSEVINLRFADPSLEGLYTHNCPKAKRFDCKNAVRKNFFCALNALRACDSLTLLMKISHLKARLIDKEQSLISVEVSDNYHLDCIYHEEGGKLVCFTILALRNIG